MFPTCTFLLDKTCFVALDLEFYKNAVQRIEIKIEEKECWGNLLKLFRTGSVFGIRHR